MKKRTLLTLLKMMVALASLPTYLLAIRPWLLRWGATDVEVVRPWPGDHLIPRPAFASTRAVTVQAPAASVWAWLSQIGEERAGTYSYTWLENLLGMDTLNIEWLVPRFQELAVGDPIQMATPARFGGRGPGIVVALEPERVLVLGHGAGRRESAAARATWAFLLAPRGAERTRLLIRARIAGHLSLPEKVAGFLAEPAHFLMERRMLLGIKDRAEAPVGARPASEPPAPAYL